MRYSCLPLGLCFRFVRAALTRPSFGRFTRCQEPAINGRESIRHQPILTERMDIDPSVTLSAKKPTPSDLSCAAST